MLDFSLGTEKSCWWHKAGCGQEGAADCLDHNALQLVGLLREGQARI